MALDTMTRLVRRRIFQVQTSSAIFGKDSISSIRSQRSNEFTIGPTLTQTVSTSPLNSHTSSKRNSIIANLRRRRLISNNPSGIKLRPFTDRGNILSLPSTSSNTIQVSLFVIFWFIVLLLLLFHQMFSFRNFLCTMGNIQRRIFRFRKRIRILRIIACSYPYQTAATVRLVELARSSHSNLGFPDISNPHHYYEVDHHRSVPFSIMMC